MIDCVFEIETEQDSEFPWCATCEASEHSLAIGHGHTPWEAIADCIADIRAIEARAGLKFKFTFTVQHSIDLDVEQIWPDGDAPRYPSVEDVQVVVAKEGGPAGVLEEWKLDRLAEEGAPKPEIVRLKIAKCSKLKAVP
jgi:hypothetical protein